MRTARSRWLQRELRWRLALPVLSIVLLGGLFSVYGAQYLVDKVFDRWLVDAARSLAEEIRFDAEKPSVDLSPQAERMLVYDVVDRVNYVVLDGSKVLLGSAGIPQAGANEQLFGNGELAFDATYLGSPVRIAWVTAGPTGAKLGVRVGVAETLIKRTRARRNLLLVFSPLSFLLVAAAFVIAQGVRRTVHPLEAMASRWNQRSHSSLDPISTDDVPRELMPFANALNDMFSRVRAILEREQRFAATAAHQLRTPLTALQLGLARAAEAATLDDARAVLSDLGETTQRTARLLQQLLALGRLDPELVNSTQFSSLDLNEVARGVGESYLDAAAQRGVRLELEEANAGQAPVTIRGQLDLICEALGNLVDNALRHTPTGGVVRMVVEKAPARLIVQDSGAGVQETERERIFERFARGQGAQGTGSGLGLAIVREIATLHGASVEVGASPDGGAQFGLTFTRTDWFNGA